MMRSEFPIIQSIIENPVAGGWHEFSDGLIIEHPAGFCQILGCDSKSTASLIDVIETDLTKEYFHFYDISPKHIKTFMDQYPNWNIRLRKRISGIHQKSINDVHISEEYSITEITELSENQLLAIPENIYQGFYSDIQNFKSESKAQIIWTAGGEFASICYAAAFGNETGEIDVFTHEKFRGQGLGECVVSRFIQTLQDHALKARWDCFIDNFGSVALAQKSGFELNKEYWFLSIYKLNEGVQMAKKRSNIQPA